MYHHYRQGKPPKQRNDLTGEHPAGDTGQIILAILFFTVWIADGFFFEVTTHLNQFVPLFIRVPLAVTLLIVSFYLVKQSHALVFHEQREKPAVIRNGVFGLVRHPMYLSELLLYLALIVLNISLAAVMICLLVFGFLHYIARYEEKLLMERFGEEYEEYIKGVPMWLPRLR